jgi:putative methionine-R-sulfoxide reductase with GAF domain
VIWWHGSGRAGIRFPHMADESARTLKQWLFANDLVGCAQHETQAARDAAVASPVPAEPAHSLGEPEPPAPPDYTAILAAMGAVRREVNAFGPNLDAALQLVADRARSFTNATGAAIALSEGDDMICRATSGPDAPGLGARFHSGSGFSGECVRAGILLRCDDCETDPRVDSQNCRTLGIRSIVAIPLRDEQRVIGLLELFSPQPCAFNQAHHLVMERLAEAVAAALRRKNTTEAASQASALPTPPEDSEPSHQVPKSSLKKVVLVVCASAAVLITVAILAPWARIRAGSPAGSAAVAVQPPASKSTARAAAPAPSDLDGLRYLADNGDPAAQFAMGARYATGDGVKQDYAEAVRWFSKAAERGHVVAQATLGAYYWAGRGVPQDLTKAYFWSILAQAGGDEASKYRVAVLTSRMSRAQVVTAQQQANDWLKQREMAAKQSARN